MSNENEKPIGQDEAGRYGLAEEAQRQSLLASQVPGEREALTFIDNAADIGILV